MTAEEIIEKLGLVPLEPEGGYFRETFRHSVYIDPSQIRPGYEGKRSLFTVIYYLLTPETNSAPHRLGSDEMWFFHLGDPAELTLEYPDGKKVTKILGNSIDRGETPQVIIPAGTVQSAKMAENKHGFSLVSTVVVPGFDYRDFELLG